MAGARSRLFFAGILFNELGTRLQGDVYCKVRQKSKELLLLMFFNKTERSISKEFRKISSLLNGRFWLGAKVRRDVSATGGDCFVESLLAGMVFFIVAQMPLAEVTGRYNRPGLSTSASDSTSNGR